ncbi:hypothetical protein BJG77_09255 [Campylobacter coli]|nr:hypothetical protein [Campylobacter coli]
MRNKELKIIEAYGAFMSILFSFLIVYEDVWTNILKIFLYTEIQAFFIFFVRIFMILHMILFMGFLLDAKIKAEHNQLIKLLADKKKKLTVIFLIPLQISFLCSVVLVFFCNIFSNIHSLDFSFYTIFICVILLYNLILLYNFTKIIRS